MVSFTEGGSSLSWTYFLSSAGGRLGIIEGHWTLALNTLEYKWRKKQPHAENDQSKPLLDNDQKCQKLTPYPKSTENDLNGQSVDSLPKVSLEYNTNWTHEED